MNTRDEKFAESWFSYGAGSFRLTFYVQRVEKIIADIECIKGEYTRYKMGGKLAFLWLWWLWVDVLEFVLCCIRILSYSLFNPELTKRVRKSESTYNVSKSNTRGKNF